MRRRPVGSAATPSPMPLSGSVIADRRHRLSRVHELQAVRDPAMLEQKVVRLGIILLILVHGQHAVEITRPVNLLAAGVVGLRPEDCAEPDQAQA